MNEERISGIFNEAIRRNPKIADRLRQSLPRLRIAASLVRVRNALGYTQRTVAERMGTPQSNVARLEKAFGNLQTMEALVAYAHACGLTLGLVFLRPEGETFEIVEAAGIGGERPDQFLRDIVTVKAENTDQEQTITQVKAADVAATYP